MAAPIIQTEPAFTLTSTSTPIAVNMDMQTCALELCSSSISSASSYSDSDDLHAPGLTSAASQHSSSAIEDELSTDASPTSPTFRIPELPLHPGKAAQQPARAAMGFSSIPFPTFKIERAPPIRAPSPARARSPVYPPSPDLAKDNGYDSGYDAREARSGSRQRSKHIQHHHHHHHPRVVIHADSDSDDVEDVQDLQPRQTRAASSDAHPRSPSLHRSRTPSPLTTPAGEHDQDTPRVLSPHQPYPNNRFLQVPEANGEQQLAAALHGLGIRHVSMPGNNRVTSDDSTSSNANLGLGISGLPEEMLTRRPKKAALSSSPRRPSAPPTNAGTSSLPRSPRPRTRNVSPLSIPHVPANPPIPPRLRGSPLLAQLKINTTARIVSAPAMPTEEDMESLMLRDGRMHRHKMFAPDSPPPSTSPSSASPLPGTAGKEGRLVYVVTPPPTAGEKPAFDGKTTLGFNPYFQVVG